MAREGSLPSETQSVSFGDIGKLCLYFIPFIVILLS